MHRARSGIKKPDALPSVWPGKGTSQTHSWTASDSSPVTFRVLCGSSQEMWHLGADLDLAILTHFRHLTFGVIEFTDIGFWEPVREFPGKENCPNKRHQVRLHAIGWIFIFQRFANILAKLWHL